MPTARAESAGGIVCDDRADGRRWVLLITHLTASGRLRWTLPKGGIEPGETPVQAAIREVREETGHRALPGKLLGTIDYWFVWRADKIRYHKFVHYFVMRWDGQPAGERDDEAEHVAWVPIEIALIRLAHKSERQLVDKARALAEISLESSIAVDR